MIALNTAGDSAARGAVDERVIADIVRLLGVRRDYGEMAALEDVDLRLEQGMSYALTGPSGSGKSTLLNMIGLLDRPTAGRCYLRGEDVTAASESVRAELRREFCGFVFQEFHLLPQRSVIENVMLGALYGGASRKWRASPRSPGSP